MPKKTNLAASISLKALAIGTLAIPSSFLFASPAAAQIIPDLPPLEVPPIIPDTCTLVGGILDCESDTSGGVDVTDSTDPLVITLGENVGSTNSIVASTLGGADITLNSLGDAVIASEGTGLDLDSSGAIVGNITGVSTAGDGATGVLLRAVDEVIFDADGTVETAGDGADGVNIEGGEIDADFAVVRTIGDDSDGIEAASINGPISLDFDTIETNGDLSSGTILRGTGDVGFSGSAISTGGTDAVGFDVSTDAAACILLGTGGCDVTGGVDEVTTEGFGGIGGLVSNSGNTNINVGVLRTGGDEAAGLDLSSDPDTCVALGVGSCNTAFTVDELTTEGARSPGAVVRGAGGITADVGVLRTGGDEAVGLDLASDPTACAVLGAGGCDTAFSVGELTTEGDGATGLLIRSAGDTNGSFGVLRTAGDDAAGADIASDPTACFLLGAGACDVGLTGDAVSTEGDGAAGVLISTLGNVTTDLGLISTNGDNSTGLGIVSSPAACLVLGPGTCAVTAQVDEVDTDGDNSAGVDVDGGEDPIDVDVGEVDTDGDNSPGVEVDGTGEIDVDVGNVDTGGDNSPGIDVDGDDDPVSVSFASVVTDGDNSPGVIVSGEGEIDVNGGTIDTDGANSGGLIVDGGDGPVTIDVGNIETEGPDSDGINAATEDGAITIAARRVRVSGAGSDGIVATAAGCGDVSIVARDDISAADGTGILASSACDVSVTTLSGASVSGEDAGIDVTSGTGATITIGDAVSSGDGPAIQVDGAAADIAIASTGSVTGEVDLTGEDDMVDNDGVFTALGTSDFGGGDDMFLNRRLFRAFGSASLDGLETFSNTGLIDLGDGAGDDVLTLSGDFDGGAGSRLALDVQAAVDGTPADRLVIEGEATGETEIALNLIGAPAVVNVDGVVIVDADGADDGAFTLADDYRSGFVSYSLRQAGDGDALLVALPNELALEPLLLSQLGQTFWYQSADAWSESAAHRRDTLSASGRGVQLWAQGYGGTEDSGKERDLDVFGTSTATDLRFDTEHYGVQGGIDFAGSGGNLAFGVTGGWETNDARFASGTRADLEGWNVGAYLLYGPPSGFYAELLAKADFFDVELRNGALFMGSKMDGKSYGVEGEIGYRMATGSMHVDLGAGLAYVKTDLDGFEASNAAFDFDGSDSLRGRAGIRVTSQAEGITPFADLKVLHEFRGENDVRFSSGGFDLPLTDAGRGTWGRGEVGLTGRTNARGVSVSAWGEIGDVEGYGLRLGIRW